MSKHSYHEEVVVHETGKVSFEILPDDDCGDSPLDWNDWPKISYRKDSRYTLGNTPVDSEDHQEIADKIESGEYVGLPVYAYIHSGVMLKAGSGFSCQWDSGQSGFVYMPKEVALKDWTTIEGALDGMRAITEEFGMWCNGEVYGFRILDEDGNELDSCWGHIGMDWAITAAREAARYQAEKQHEDNLRMEREAKIEEEERLFWAERDVATV